MHDAAPLFWQMKNLWRFCPCCCFIVNYWAVPWRTSCWRRDGIEGAAEPCWVPFWFNVLLRVRWGTTMADAKQLKVSAPGVFQWGIVNLPKKKVIGVYGHPGEGKAAFEEHRYRGRWTEYSPNTMACCSLTQKMLQHITALHLLMSTFVISKCKWLISLHRNVGRGCLFLAEAAVCYVVICRKCI